MIDVTAKIVQGRASLASVVDKVSTLSGTNKEIMATLDELILSESAWLLLLDRNEVVQGVQEALHLSLIHI